MAENISTVGKKIKALANPLRDEGIGSGDYLDGQSGLQVAE